MLALEKLGGIKIIEESASHYHEIGTFLLHDRHGTHIKNIRSGEKNNIDTMREIYKRWLREDEHHSWETLCHTFRDFSLNDLAHRVEQHVGLTSPGDKSKVPSNGCVR